MFDVHVGRERRAPKRSLLKHFTRDMNCIISLSHWDDDRHYYFVAFVVS